jgi:hypothetical protein
MTMWPCFSKPDNASRPQTVEVTVRDEHHRSHHRLHRFDEPDPRRRTCAGLRGVVGINKNFNITGIADGFVRRADKLQAPRCFSPRVLRGMASPSGKMRL